MGDDELGGLFVRLIIMYFSLINLLVQKIGNSV